MHLRVTTAVQYRYGMHWTQIQAWLPFIGDLHFVEGTRRINISDPRSRVDLWRGTYDVGWHLVVGLVGRCKGQSFSVRYSKFFTTRTHQTYDCEDTAHLQFELQAQGETAAL